MKKSLLCLIAFATLCVSNAWGTDDETDTYIWKETPKQLTIKASGYDEGVMSNYGTSDQPWSKVLSKVKRIIVEEGITTIGKNAFYGAQYLESITLPISLKSIKSDAFYDAGKSLSKDDTLHYAGSPSEWASVSISYRYAHPLQRAGHYYFYGSDTKTTILILPPTIKEVKRLAFYNGTFSDVCIPGTIKNIRDSAFRCSISTSIAINRDTAPSLGTNALPSLSKPLYIPYTNHNYTDSPWSSYTKKTQVVSGNTLDSYGANVTWELDSAGVLTLDATSGSKNITIDAASTSAMPWYYFRRLVHKIIVKGEVTGLNNTLHYHFGISEIELDQVTIPTLSDTYIATNSSTPYANLANDRDKLTLTIHSASLSDESASNLSNNPWHDGKWDIQLSDNLVISDENTNNTTLLANCSTYVKKPITLKLNRTLVGGGEQYNTFCSPIALTAAQLNDADIRALVGSSLDDNVLTLTFSSSSLDNIVAGQPYLVKPSSELANPTFTNIAPNSLVSTTTPTVTTYVDFIGVLAPTLLTGDDKNTLFLGADNELLWPEADANIKGMRAYFSVKGEAQQAAKRARIVMNKDAATGIQNTEHRTQTQKILRDGQIIIIRDGKEYNVMGMECK